MAKPPQFFVGTDWGQGDSQSVTSRWAHVDGKYVPISRGVYAQYEQLNDDVKRRKRRSAELLIDFKIGTTKGKEQQSWLRAKRYLQLGKGVVVGWKHTS